MTKTNLVINEVINKVSKANKPYKVFETTMGTCSAFDKEIVAYLEANVGNEVEVEVIQRNGFQNITSISKDKAIDKPTSKAATVGDAMAGMGLEIESYCEATKKLLQKIADAIKK